MNRWALELAEGSTHGWVAEGFQGYGSFVCAGRMWLRVDWNQPGADSECDRVAGWLGEQQDKGFHERPPIIHALLDNLHGLLTTSVLQGL